MYYAMNRSSSSSDGSYRSLDGYNVPYIAIRYDVHTVHVSGDILVTVHEDRLGYIGGRQPRYDNGKLYITAVDDECIGILGDSEHPHPEILYLRGNETDRNGLNTGGILASNIEEIQKRNTSATFTAGTLVFGAKGRECVSRITSTGDSEFVTTSERMCVSYDQSSSPPKQEKIRYYVHLSYRNTIRKVVLRGKARVQCDAHNYVMFFPRICIKTYNKSSFYTDAGNADAITYGRIDIHAHARSSVMFPHVYARETYIQSTGDANVVTPKTGFVMECQSTGQCEHELYVSQQCVIRLSCQNAAMAGMKITQFNYPRVDSNQYMRFESFVSPPASLERSPEHNEIPCPQMVARVVNELGMGLMMQSFTHGRTFMPQPPPLRTNPFVAAVSSSSSSGSIRAQLPAKRSAESQGGTPKSPTPPDLTTPVETNPERGLCSACLCAPAVIVCRACEVQCLCLQCCVHVLEDANTEKRRCPLCKDDWVKQPPMRPKVT